MGWIGWTDGTGRMDGKEGRSAVWRRPQGKTRYTDPIIHSLLYLT